MRRIIPSIIFISALLWGCSGPGSAGRPEGPDGNVTPTMVTESVISFVSDSGITRYRMEAPVWKMYDNADEPFWHFPQGMELHRFDDSMNIAAVVVSDTATYFSRRKLWRLDGNVRMRNVDGDKFLTRQLFWDQRTHTVYSDSFIHIERGGRILEGYGFTSDEQITAYTIRRPTGIFPTEGFEQQRTPAPAPSSPTPVSLQQHTPRP